jgi:tetraacyldisaccharide 4'-kinase
VNWRGGIENWLNARWYGAAPVPLWLGGLEWIYRRLLALRRALYARSLWHSQRLSVPVIVVGNLTVGGTGKTPLVARLARELRDRAWRPGIVSRGYRGSSRHAELLPATAAADRYGDEPVWLMQSSGCPVAIGKRRGDAARLLIGAGCNLIISDDGLQHWALARDLEILMIDGERRFGNGRLLPAGPLREAASRAVRVDYCVVNGGAAAANEIAMQVQARSALRVNALSRSLALAELRGQRVHAVAGIGNPERFFSMLEQAGLQVVRHPLPDHHRYDGSELRFADDAIVLVTEKDAGKLAQVAHDRVYAVPIELLLPEHWFDAIHQQLCQLRGDRT